MMFTDTKCELIDSMGTDLSVVNAARVSFNQDDVSKYNSWVNELAEHWENTKSISKVGRPIARINPRDLLKIYKLRKTGLTVRDTADKMILSGSTYYKILSNPKHPDHLQLKKAIDRPQESDPRKDIKLINYLADHGHTSPFEHCTATFMIKCPLFIARQIMRHRTFSYNEISRRYTSSDLEFWAPTQFRAQAKKNLQCSDGVLDNSDELMQIYENMVSDAHALYQELLDEGVSREQARAVLPQCMHTSFYMTGNLLNWVKFIKLRDSEHAQPEAQVIAQFIKDELVGLYPHSMEAWFK